MKHPRLQYDSPVKFSIKQRLVLSLGVPPITWAYKALCASSRWTVLNQHHLEEAKSKSGRALVAFWHESLGLAAWRFRKTGGHTLTSYSFDGELAAQVVRRFGLEAVRGSSSRGGLRALAHLARAFECTDMVGFTLDGPKGPRREAKGGIAMLAHRAGAPIIPNAYAIRGGWRLNSWDRLMVPGLFGVVTCAFGPPIPPPADRAPGSLEATRREVEASLNRLHDELEVRVQEHGKQ